jgi:hypothetical protein
VALRFSPLQCSDASVKIGDHLILITDQHEQGASAPLGRLGKSRKARRPGLAGTEPPRGRLSTGKWRLTIARFLPALKTPSAGFGCKRHGRPALHLLSEPALIASEIGRVRLAQLGQRGLIYRHGGGLNRNASRRIRGAGGDDSR